MGSLSFPQTVFVKPNIDGLMVFASFRATRVRENLDAVVKLSNQATGDGAANSHPGEPLHARCAGTYCS
eukprot:5208304-Amphidinium_carterae.1